MANHFWNSLSAVLAEGHSVFLVLVGDSTPGSPGSVGARMFVTDAGDQTGTIGGGVMEHRLTARAREELAHGETLPRTQTLWHRREAPGEASGMICSGSQTNVYVPCYPVTHLDIIQRIADLAIRFEPFRQLGIVAQGLFEALALFRGQAAVEEIVQPSV